MSAMQRPAKARHDGLLFTVRMNGLAIRMLSARDGKTWHAVISPAWVTLGVMGVSTKGANDGYLF